jgi:putative methyltransferase (TIGR04325 family)
LPAGDAVGEGEKYNPVTVNKILKLIMPPLVIQAYHALRIRIHPNEFSLSGDYGSWADAQRASTGYDSAVILEKTKAALLKVKTGEAVHERDSVLFDEVQYSWPLLAGLMWAAAQSGGVLNVLDFGGSLGSTYFQNRAFLNGLRTVRWNIVEQPRHLEVGKEFFEDDRFKFFSSIKDYVAASQPNVVILSGVLQYLEWPYEVLDELMGLNSDCIIIDRTPFWDGAKDRLCVQSVPPEIFKASLPIRIFSRRKFIDFLEKRANWHLGFDSLEKIDGYRCRGFLATCKS